MKDAVTNMSDDRVPDGWQIATIESLCKRVTSGATPLRSNPAFYENGIIPWFRTKELNDWYIDDSEEKITQKALENSSVKLFPPNTVLMAMYGDGRTITSLGIIRKESATNQACCALIVNPKVCDHLFLFYALKYHRDDFIHLALGGAQRNLSGKLIRKFMIKVPPLETQRKTASLLSVYDRLIENNRKRIQVLEAMAQTLYREWFVHFRYPGHENTEIVETDYGPMPITWKLAKLSEVCSLITDGTHDTPKPVEEAGYFLVMGKHIKNGFIDFSGCYKISKEDHKKVIQRSNPEKGDILFTNIGTLGNTALVDQEFEYSIKNVALLKPLKPSYSKFLFLRLSSEKEIESLLQRASGTSQRFLGLSTLRSAPVVFPEDKILLEFDGLVCPVFALRSILWEQIQVLIRCRDLLLPKLISGKINVG